MSDGLGYLVGDFQIAETNYTAISAQKTVAKPDPSRWAIIFSASVSGQAVNISTQSGVTVQSGIQLSSQTNTLAFNFRDLGAVVSGAWYGIGGATAALTVVEIFYRPQGVPIVTTEMLERLAEKMERADSLLAANQAVQR